MANLLYASSSPSSSIQIQDLTRNPGIVTIKLGIGRVRIGSHKIFHVIELTQFEPTFYKLEQIIRDLNIFNMTETTDLIRIKYNSIKNTYNNLIPKQRTKRGLINILGSSIKLITGNLDNNDLIEINNQLETLFQNEKTIVTQNNEQIKINKQLENKMNRIIKKINEQQNIIVKNLIKSREAFLNGKDNLEQIKVIKEIINLNMALDLLKDQVQNIFECIQLSKVNVIHKTLLSPEELIEATNILRNSNITIDTFDQTYEYLELAIIHKDTKIVFVISIPNFKSTTFNHILMEPIPREGHILKLRSSLALSNDFETYLIRDDCQEIKEEIICDKNQVENVSQDICYSKILKGVSGRCDYTEDKSTKILKRISNNHLLLKGNNTLMESNCGIPPRNLSGTIIVYFRNCTIKIEGIPFNNIEYYNKEPPLIIPLYGIEILPNHIESNLTLQKLNEIHLQTREHLLQLHRKQLSFTLGTGTPAIILSSVLAIYLLRNRFRALLRSPAKERNSEHSVPVRSTLEGGAVIDNTGTSRGTPASGSDSTREAKRSARPVIDTASHVSVLALR